MAIKKQTFIMSVVFNEDEIYANSAAEAVSHAMYNEEGIYEWDVKLWREELLSADITDEDVAEFREDGLVDE